jgi:hypothetical protein
MGSAAINHQGDIAVGYSVSSATVFPSIRYAARLGTDAAGTGLAQGEQTIIVGGGAQISSSSRWGDYSDLTVDPTDDCSFWYTQEYYAASGNSIWRTNIAKFVPGPVASAARGTITGTITNCTSGLPIQNAFIQIAGGVARQTNASGVYTASIVPGTYTVIVSAAGGYSPVTIPGVVVTNAGTITINTCLTGIPVLSATSSTITAESCLPGNSGIDPGETVSVSFCIKNTGGANSSNMVATLLSTGGITTPSAPQNFGTVITGAAAVCRTFSFIPSGVCGSTITASIQLQDGASNLGTVSYTFTLGSTSTIFSENFDLLAAPALPPGWTTSQGTVSAFPLWVSSNTGDPLPSASSTPNAIFSTDPNNIIDNRIETPGIIINKSGTKLSFKHNFNLEDGWDGGVLEISIPTVLSGAFQDILAAGGSFSAGGYNATLGNGSNCPIADRQAWTGNSNGFITTTVNLPASAVGQTVKFRFRIGSDDNTPVSGWRIDDVTVKQPSCCTNSIPPSVIINQAPLQADPAAASPINFRVEFSDNVTGFTTGDITLSGTAGATTAVVTGSGSLYNVAVSGMTGAGTVIASIAPGVAVNINTLANFASTSTDNTVLFDNVFPTVVCPANITVTAAANICNSVVNYNVSATDNLSGLVFTRIAKWFQLSNWYYHKYMEGYRYSR